MNKAKLVLSLFIMISISTFAQKKAVNVEKSQVEWTGNKIGGSHNGQINIKSASLVFDGENIVGGDIVIDMTSIVDKDLEDATYNAKLVGHLKSDDFFGVEKFPTSNFKITKSTAFKNGKATLHGELTIKKKTEKIEFEIIKAGNSYTAQVKIDRSKFDVRYGSNSFFDNLGDKAIDDIFILDIKLEI